jgi:hypothetical protein
LPNTFGLGLIYGFTRKTEKLYYKDFYYHSFEYAFLENKNSKSLFANDNLDKLDLWSFGFGWADGYSTKITDEFDIEFVHDISVNWMKSFYPTFPNEEILIDFQDNWRFGSNFRSGINIPIRDNIFIETRYENNLNFNQFLLVPWLIGFATENALQKFPNFFESALIESLNKAYPIMIWVYKSFISYSLYKLREENSFWPGNGRESLTGEGFSINIKFLF